MRSTLRNLGASDKKRSHGLEMGRLQVQVLRPQGLQSQENLEMNIWNHEIDFNLITFNWFEVTFNWFEVTFNWFQFTFNWFQVNYFQLISSYFQLNSSYFQLIWSYFQLISIYLQLISIYFQVKEKNNHLSKQLDTIVYPQTNHTIVYQGCSWTTPLKNCLSDVF